MYFYPFPIARHLPLPKRKDTHLPLPKRKGTQPNSLPALNTHPNSVPLAPYSEVQYQHSIAQF